MSEMADMFQAMVGVAQEERERLIRELLPLLQQAYRAFSLTGGMVSYDQGEEALREALAVLMGTEALREWGADEDE